MSTPTQPSPDEIERIISNAKPLRAPEIMLHGPSFSFYIVGGGPFDLHPTVIRVPIPTLISAAIGAIAGIVVPSMTADIARKSAKAD